VSAEREGRKQKEGIGSGKVMKGNSQKEGNKGCGTRGKRTGISKTGNVVLQGR